MKDKALIFITKLDELSPLISGIQSCIDKNIMIGLDTEFERRTTFYPKPALLQFQVEDLTYLVDPLSCKPLDVLFEALSHAKVLMHACREDLEVFRIISDHRLGDFFDTQTAASFLGLNSQVSYQKLVGDFLGVELDKSETCSDWIKRPLTEKQIIYAADDVIYLEKIRHILFQKLEDLGRMDWYLQEMSFLKDLLAEPFAEEYFFKMKGLTKLNATQLQGAYDLLLWREKISRSKNIPRGFIIKDKAFLEIFNMIGVEEINAKSLYQSKEIPSPFVRRYADTISSIVGSPSVSDQSLAAIERLQKKLPDSSKAIKKEIKAFRDTAANELNIKAEVLLSNRLLDIALNVIFFEWNHSWSLAKTEQAFSSALQPWRYQVFEKSFVDILEEMTP